MRTVAAIGCSLALMSISLSARAEGDAERLFREGRALMLEGRFDEACPMIAESQRLDPHVGTLLNLAACHERQGKIASAWVEYQKALTAARAEGQADRVRLAESRITAIEPRVPWLRIVVRDGATVTLDGAPIVAAAFGTEMPVDSGSHVVEARLDDKTPFEARLDLVEGQHRTVEVTFSEPIAPLPPPESRLVVEQPATAPPEAKKSRWVFEPGLYVAYADGDLHYPEPVGGPSAIALENDSTRERTTCAGQFCSFGSTSVVGTASAGLNLFTGYAFNDFVRGGLRLVAGPMFSGGVVIAGGPSLSLVASRSLTIGVWGAFGDATLSGYAPVIPPTRYRYVGSNSSNPRVDGNLAGALGAGLEASCRLTTIGRGDLLATLTPFFLSNGRGSIFALPIGVAYRFE